jgi:hypothetical protein
MTFGDMHLAVNENEGITLVCMHADHKNTTKGVAYYGEAGYHNHLPLFHELDGLFNFMREHALSHFKKAEIEKS